MAEIIRSTTFFPVNPWVLFRDNDNKNGHYMKGKTYKNERRNSLSNKRTAFHVHILRFRCRFRTSFFFQKSIFVTYIPLILLNQDQFQG